MEKIQSAIAKARAQREEVISEKAVPPVTAAPRQPNFTLGEVASQPAAAEAFAEPSMPSSRMLSTDEVMGNWLRLPVHQPDPAHLQKRRIVTYLGGKEAVTFDVMRTKLLQQMKANNWRRLAITSPSASCGKSTTCLNLAFSLARQTELRTVVAEVDLRRPSLAGMLGTTRKHSFADVLRKQSSFEENAFRVGNNLIFATNSTSARNPSELLQNANVPVAISEIESRYEPTIILFDMPPMMVSDDAMAFVGQVDCVLLVAAAETTTIQEVDLCERELASQTNVLGVILNKCRYLDRKYGYSYYG